MSAQENPPPPAASFKGLDFVANLMDNQFRVPFTEIRFGLDSLLGLFPGLGDAFGMAISSTLVWTMVRRGAGPLIMLQMLGNIILDALIGVVPFLGDIFDFGFKANRRNVDLMKAYYADGRAKPNAFWSLLFLFILLLAVVTMLLVGLWKLGGWLWQIIFS
jgi:hypothetical protein